MVEILCGPGCETKVIDATNLFASRRDKVSEARKAKEDRIVAADLIVQNLMGHFADTIKQNGLDLNDENAMDQINRIIAPAMRATLLDLMSRKEHG